MHSVKHAPIIHQPTAEVMLLNMKKMQRLKISRLMNSIIFDKNQK